LATLWHRSDSNLFCLECSKPFTPIRSYRVNSQVSNFEKFDLFSVKVTKFFKIQPKPTRPNPKFSNNAEFEDMKIDVKLPVRLKTVQNFATKLRQRREFGITFRLDDLCAKCQNLLDLYFHMFEFSL
jgi:hypothetical protein